MGMSQSWIAVRGLEPETALEVLGVELSGTVSPDEVNWRTFLLMGQFRKDWLVVLSDDGEDAFDGRLARLAELGPAVAFQISENVMYSEARGYEDGEEIWKIAHDPSKHGSVYALEIEGTIPKNSRPSSAMLARNKMPRARKTPVQTSFVAFQNACLERYAPMSRGTVSRKDFSIRY